MDDGKEFESDRQRAEVFDALGHPTRIAILKALREEPLGFADLKKKTGIESSGHLTHHLGKLDKLIKTDEYGKYCLSDQGKDALLTVQTVEKASVGPSRFRARVGLKAISLALAVLLIAISVFAAFGYNQAATLQNQINHSVASDYFAFYNEYGLVPQTNVNSSWTPPVSMLTAARIGLEAEGYNRTSLYNKRLSVSLWHYERAAENQSFLRGYDVRAIKDANGVPHSGYNITTSPPQDYLPVTDGNVISSYAWVISVSSGTIAGDFPFPIGSVDAVTGEIMSPY